MALESLDYPDDGEMEDYDDSSDNSSYSDENDWDSLDRARISKGSAAVDADGDWWRVVSQREWEECRDDEEYDLYYPVLVCQSGTKKLVQLWERTKKGSKLLTWPSILPAGVSRLRRRLAPQRSDASGSHRCTVGLEMQHFVLI